MAAARHQGFEHFVATDGERLRRVLVARYGVEVGWDACAEALAYGWTHWERVGAMDNPAGYLYRVAVSATRRHRRWQRSIELPHERSAATDDLSGQLDGDLGSALARLRPPQRTSVVLAHVYGWSHADIAAITGLSVAAVRNHVHRGLRRLRELLDEGASR